MYASPPKMTNNHPLNTMRMFSDRTPVSQQMTGVANASQYNPTEGTARGREPRAGLPSVERGRGVGARFMILKGNKMSTNLDALAASIAEVGATVAVAESLTGGLLASALAAAPGASEWFKGGVVAYAPDVKFDLLGVSEGPVISETCAREMAAGVHRLLRAHVGVAVTGVGGPGFEEGHPSGTVFAAVHTTKRVVVREWRFDGDPEQVLDQTIRATLELLALEVTALDARVRG